MASPRRFLSPLALASLAALALSSAPALAQEEGEALPASEHPGSDSPEAVTAGAVRSAIGRKRAQAFLIPLDEKARAPTGRVAQALERALGAAKQYEVVDLAKALASDAEPAQEQKAQEGKKLLADGNAAFASRAYPDAVQKYKAAIKGLTSGLAALDTRDIADAFLRLAAAQQLSGDAKDVKASRDSYLAAALLDPGQRLQAAAIDPVAEQPLLLARNDLEQVPIGKLELETRPVGARIFIDGQPQGTTPARVELTGGKHVLRLERTGFYPTAELIDVASRRETLYSVTLSATPGASTLNQLIAGAADEASHGRSGEKTAALAEKFRLDRVLVGSISSHGIKVSVLLALTDPKSGQMIGRQEMLLTADGTDADQLEFDTQEAARKLLALDEGRPADASASPAPMGSSLALPLPAAPAQPSGTSMYGSSASPAPAPATTGDGSRRAMMPGASSAVPPPPAEPSPTADDPGLVGRDRRAVSPGASAFDPPPAAAPMASSAPSTSSSAPADAPAAEQTAGQKEKKKKKKDKDLHAKSGTEGWDSN